jgi:uncharacterized membrane protein YoaK (UPF0700 family)
MNPSAPRRLLRLARRKTTRLLQARVGLGDLQRGIEQTIERTIDHTLDLMPLDSSLLMRHGNRSPRLNRQLAWSLAFVAGAVNAGGFLAVQKYTSHVSGAVSLAADELTMGNKTLGLAALSIVACFAAGAFCASLLISFGRRHRFRSHYALSLVIEGALLMVFGFMGYRLQYMQQFLLPVTVVLLAFIMGMHNSVVTTISAAEVRTTHMTGIVTDIGLELGRLMYFNRDRNRKVKLIIANRNKLKLHGLILVSFFGGGLVGALSFRHIGFKMTVPLAAFLFFLAVRPIMHDLRVRMRLLRQPGTKGPA